MVLNDTYDYEEDADDSERETTTRKKTRTESWKVNDCDSNTYALLLMFNDASGSDNLKHTTTHTF